MRKPQDEDVVTISAAELREASLDDLIRMMDSLGLATAEIKAKSEAITSLVNNAYSVH